jgi:RecA-family ATPase
VLVYHDVAEYVQQEVYDPPFFIGDLLARGGSLELCGQTGVMKSWMVQQMGFCIATGTEWLSFHVSQAKCLLANFEISPPRFHHRLVLMARNFSVEMGMLIEMSPSYYYLDEGDHFANFKETVEALNPEVIIMDCLSGCFGGDENSPRDMGNFIRMMSELKGENRGIILVHHTNKNPLILSPVEKSRGHSKLTGWVDTVLFLTNQPTGKQLQFGKTRHSTSELHSMNLTFENYLWAVRGHHPQAQEEVHIE